jgi:nitrogen fixation/metabolism regulation signal transduction histidine kinase
MTFGVALLLLFAIGHSWLYRLTEADIQKYAERPEHVAEAKIRVNDLAWKLQTDRAYAIAFILIAVSLVSWLIARRAVLRPVNDLYLRHYAVSRGQYEISGYPDWNNEFSGLYEMFHRMVADIERQKEELSKTERRIFSDHILAAAHAQVFQPLRDCVAQINQIRNTQKELTPEGRAKLDEIVRELERVSTASIELASSDDGLEGKTS